MKIVLAMLGVLLLIAGLGVAFTTPLELVKTCTNTTGSYYVAWSGDVSDKVTGADVTASILMFNAGHVAPYSQQYQTAYSSAGQYFVQFHTNPGDGGIRMQVDAVAVGYDQGTAFTVLPCPEDLTGGVGSSISQPYVLRVDFLMGKTPQVQAAFTFQVVGNSVTFYDASVGGPNSWTWTFGAGIASTATAQPSIGYTYAAPGTYTVTMVAKRTTDGSTSTATGSVTVSPAATASGTSTQTPASGTSTGNATTTTPPSGDGNRVSGGGGGFQVNILSIVLFIFGGIILIIAVAWRGGA